MGRLARLRQPEWLVFLPALTLAAFWLGGEQVLLLTALGAPLVFLGAGALRSADSFVPQVPGEPGGPGQRSQLIDRLDRVLRDALAGGQTACLVLRIDGAERLAERHGRATQAMLLAQAADRIGGALLHGDLAVRLEGGGFAVAPAAMPRLGLEDTIQIAARLQNALALPISHDGRRWHLTASAGFCLAARAPDATGIALLEAAELAADEAQRHGPGALRAFSAEMARSTADRSALQRDLQRALEDGQICAYFQPQLITATGALAGFEALARWHHPTRGLISPAEFLPLIEACGLSERLGEIMLYNALGALRHWDAAGLAVPRVAVNLSAQELRIPRLADKLKWELDRFDIAAQRLCLEVLETVIAAPDDDVTAANIAALSRLGCGIDLDDFGTGHASITSIRRFAVRRLKIDRSFVTRLDQDRGQQQMVAAILSMAGQLGLETLAEGVETLAERNALHRLGCAEVQGFGIAPPLPLAEATQWIRQHRGRGAAAEPPTVAVFS